MGRRPQKTTKGGKFMNPTDQARKEARRRELKKNKKQRDAVRQAVIKNKDPVQMIRELEELDDMELKPEGQFQLNEKVVKEKRRKLLETLIRTINFYSKEDPSRGKELRNLIEDYKMGRIQKETYFESVRNAQTVDIGEIPLPEMPFETPDLSDIPLPDSMPHSILKRQQFVKGESQKTSANVMNAPGHPPGNPPSKKVFISRDSAEYTNLVRAALNLGSREDAKRKKKVEMMTSYHDDVDDEFRHRDDDVIDDDFGDFNPDEPSSSKHRKIRFADDDDITQEDDDVTMGHVMTSQDEEVTPLQAMMLKLAGQNVPAPQKKKEVVTMGKPPPGPPGPPPGMPPTGLPPPGLPPQFGLPPAGLPPNQKDNSHFSAPPSLIPRPPQQLPPQQPGPQQQQVAQQPPQQQDATISAKPQLTGGSRFHGDATKFMPTSLRVKRQKVVTPGMKLLTSHSRGDDITVSMTSRHIDDVTKGQEVKKSADDAYDSFMSEMKGLL